MKSQGPPQVLPSEKVAEESARARLTPVSCEGCGTDFTPSRPLQQCCPARCRAAMSRRREDERRTELLERLWPDDPGRPEWSTTPAGSLLVPRGMYGGRDDANDPSGRAP
jgi:hypothetical protein